jgi:hypothetical protein
MADVTYAGQIVREAPEIEAYKLGLLKAAQTQIAQPISMPAYQAAGLSDLQRTATGAAGAYQTAGQGIGGYAPFLSGAAQQLGSGQQALTAAGQGIANINVQPYFNTAATGMNAAAATAGGMSPFITGMGGGLQNIAQGTQTLGTAQQTAAGGTGMFDPNMAQQFMNPYQQQVIDQALQQINRQGQLQQQNLSAQAVKSGAFGGTREGVQRAELGRNLAEAQNQAIIGGLQQGYGQAMNTAQQSFEAARQRQLGTGQALAGIGQAQSQQGMLGANLLGQQAGLLGQQSQLQSSIAQGIGGLGAQQAQTGLGLAGGLAQVGQGLGGLGIQQAQLGTTAQQLAQGDINTYLGLGGLQQQTAQNQLDAARATELQKTMMPYQQLGFLSDIYKGAPTSSSTLTGMTAPSTSPLLQAAGLGMAAIGTAAGAKSAGLFG